MKGRRTRWASGGCNSSSGEGSVLSVSTVAIFGEKIEKYGAEQCDHNLGCPFFVFTALLNRNRTTLLHLQIKKKGAGHVSCEIEILNYLSQHSRRKAKT
jgi:hypothetical protein